MTNGRRLTPEELAQRKKAIVAARRDHESFDSIGATHGISAARAHQVFWAALSEIPGQEVGQYRQEQVDLVDRAVHRLMMIAEDDDVSPRSRIEAWSAIRGWAEHLARLMGLNSPTRREISVLSESVVDAALAKAAEDHAAKVRELETLEQRAIAAAAEILDDED